MEIKIDSYALRRKLSQELQFIYKDRNLIFTEFSKGSPVFTVRKYKPVDKSKGYDGKDTPKKDVKLDIDEFEDSDIDKIIKGDRSEINVLFEDDKLIAYEEITGRVTKEHFKVIAKDKKLTSLQKVKDEDEAILGHMMLTVSKIAKDRMP